MRIVGPIPPKRMRTPDQIKHVGLEPPLRTKRMSHQESAVIYHTMQERSRPPTDTARLPSLITHTLVTLEQCAMPEDAWLVPSTAGYENMHTSCLSFAASKKEREGSRSTALTSVPELPMTPMEDQANGQVIVCHITGARSATLVCGLMSCALPPAEE